MFRIKSILYGLTDSPGVFEIVKKRQIFIEWVVEAGCHDGSDTVRFTGFETLRKIYAFEPDPVARTIAIKRCSVLQGKGIVEIFPFALVEHSEQYRLLENGGLLGTGSSQVLKNTEPNNSSISTIQGRRLDEIVHPQTNAGLLWLDVEGSALDALRGASKLFESIKLIQVEVEFQDMWGRRERNYDRVIEYLHEEGFLLMYAPVYPGLFGDLTFIRRDDANSAEKLRSYTLRNILTLLHSTLFPFTHRKEFTQ